MKKLFTIICAAIVLFVGNSVKAQETAKEEKKGYEFTDIKRLPISSIKDQNQAGTCWCYSTLAFIESELMRMGKPEIDLSEMYLVYKTYMDRAMATVRTHGDVSFSQGGSFYDVIYGMKHYGVVPDVEMPAGVMYGDTLSNHYELSAVTEAYVEAIAGGKLKKLQSNKEGEMLWANGLEGIYDAYLGVCPEKFNY